MEQTEKQKLWKANNYQDKKEYFAAKQKERRNEIKEFINNLKTKCITCGESDTGCLDFHHIDRNEKGDELTAARRDKWSNKKILKEVEKCVVLCSNCHRKLHYYDLTVEGLKEYIL